jgi:dihydrofolate reductase
VPEGTMRENQLSLVCEMAASDTVKFRFTQILMMTRRSGIGIREHETGRSGKVRKLVATEYVTLDAVMEESGMWSFPFWNDEAMQFKLDELFASDALLLGRITYEGFAKAWPTMTEAGEFGERMNALPKFVVSRTLQTLEWNNSHLLPGDVAEAVTYLKQQPGQDILLAGSAQLLRTLMQHDLVDEYRLMVHPLVLGSGKRLFAEDSHKTTLHLVDTKTTSTGIVILTYHPAHDEAAR